MKIFKITIYVVMAYLTLIAILYFLGACPKYLNFMPNPFGRKVTWQEVLYNFKLCPLTGEVY